jgi:hypothetical protein
MGALVLFGVLPEEYWPYVIADFDKEPSAFCYAFAQNYHAISCYRLAVNLARKRVLFSALTSVAAQRARSRTREPALSLLPADATGAASRVPP